MVQSQEKTCTYLVKCRHINCVSGHVARFSRYLTYMFKVNRKHDRLQSEIEKLSTSLPAMAESANRVQDMFQPYSRNVNNKNSLTVLEYDQKVCYYLNMMIVHVHV